MEQLFLNLILAEPENELHPQVYADWLEEQGDPKAEKVRAWCVARKKFTEETMESLILAVGELDSIIEALGAQFRRQCACEFAWRVLHFYETNFRHDSYPRQAIISAWNFSLGEVTESELNAADDAMSNLENLARREESWQAASAARAISMACGGDRYGGVWTESYYCAAAAADVAASAVAENSERWKQLVIAASYLLFGGNALPDRFDLETANRHDS